MTPSTPSATPNNELEAMDDYKSPSAIAMDRGEEESNDENKTHKPYNLRSSKGSYRTSYGRKIKTPERLTTGAFQFIQEAIALAINEEAQNITPTNEQDKPMYDKE